MLCFGDEKISALYVGGKKIKKAYVGGVLVFGSGAGKPSRLPEGYTELEYIVLGPVASMYNFTLASATVDQMIRIDFEIMQFPQNDNQYPPYANPTLISSTAVSGTRPNTIGYNRSFLWISNSGLWAASNSYSVSTSDYIHLSSSTKTPQRISLLWDGPNTQISINGKAPIKFSSYGVGNYGWIIGSSMVSPYNYWNDASIRIYGITITSRGDSSNYYNKDFIPAKNSYGSVGFYDTVSGNFEYNAAFTAGPAI